MNDTIAIIGTPLMLYFARTLKIAPKLLLLTLAFAVTIGSALSPIGNPQNLLIAVNADLSNPFLVFLQYLLLPTVANLLLAYLLLRLFYRGQFQNRTLADLPGRDLGSGISPSLQHILSSPLRIDPDQDGSSNPGRWRRVSADLHRPYLGAAHPSFQQRRYEVLRSIDWCTLIFFAAMFVLMESVWMSGIFQSLLAGSNADLASIPTILAFSVLLSQLISNVPLVALCQPLLVNPSPQALMALAAGSTIAGNLFILGAASNVIIIQNAEKSGETLTFLEFARVGVPLTVLNVLVYWLFL